MGEGSPVEQFVSTHHLMSSSSSSSLRSMSSDKRKSSVTCSVASSNSIASESDFAATLYGVANLNGNSHHEVNSHRNSIITSDVHSGKPHYLLSCCFCRSFVNDILHVKIRLFHKSIPLTIFKLYPVFFVVIVGY